MMRDRIKNMNNDDKALSMKYVTNLIKLSKLYWNSGSGENHVYYG